jgi:DNA-binding SARP family transcriptional activator
MAGYPMTVTHPETRPHLWAVPGAEPARPARPVATEERDADVLPFPGGRTGAVPAAGFGQGEMELGLLGGFRLVVGGELVPVGPSGERVLAVIACRGRQISRAKLAQVLWPDTSSERAHANLRTAVYRLVRRAPGVVHVTGGHIQLSSSVRVDLDGAARLAQRLLAGPVDQDDDGSDTGVDFYEDLLPDWDEEWLADHQRRYRQLRLTALEALAARLGSAGRHGAAVQAALAAVQADGLRDSAHETLIRAHLAQGNRHEAYLHFTAYRRILRDELGLEPPAAIRQLLSTA